MTNFEKVQEFHEKFEVSMPSDPRWPDAETIKLRIKLIQEEVKEWEVEATKALDAINSGHDLPEIMTGSLVDAAKELADILYVVYGAGEAFGVDMDKVFAAVHEANLTKLGEDGKPVRREDGKVMKGPNYQPANIYKVLFND